MHYEEFRDHKYLGAWSFMEGDRTVTIARVVQGLIDRDDERMPGQAPPPPERVALMYFEELDLPLVLNSTNGKMIYMMYGTPDVRQWVGKRVTLTAALTTNTSGQPVMGIRVHPQRPAEAPVVEETPEAKRARLEAELAALTTSKPALAPPAPVAAAPAPEVTHASS